MDPNLQTPQPPVQQPAPIAPKPSSARLGKILLAASVVIILVLLSIILIVNRKIGNPAGKYLFTIDGQAVPQEDFKAIFDYYRAQDANGDKEQLVSTIQNLYVENYVLKKEYFASGKNQSELDGEASQLEAGQSPPLEPATLKKLNHENQIIRTYVLSGMGLTSRSGNQLSVGIINIASPEEKKNLETLAIQRLTVYRNQLVNKTNFEQVKLALTNDAQLKANSKFVTTGGPFTTDVSHPSLPGKDYADKVFKTPPNQVSEIYKAEMGTAEFVGVIIPSTPIVNAEFKDIREWLADKKKTVEVKTDFSDF